MSRADVVEIGAGAPAHVGGSRHDTRADGAHEIVTLEQIQQVPHVAAAGEPNPAPVLL